MKQSIDGIDLSLDYHAHILPRCDHGSNGIETSLKQIEMAKSAGIKTICATPHFYPHKESVESFLERRKQCYEILKSNLTPAAPSILLGAEVLICDGMERLQGLTSLCRQGTNELLLEMPFYKWQSSMWDTLYLLNEREDITLVIAHADRYLPEEIDLLIREKIRLQLNAECLSHPLHRRRYLSWIEKGAVSYIGSDIHMLGKGYRDYEKSRKIINRRIKV